MRSWCLLLCVAIAFGSARPGWAQEATLDPPEPQLGERARLRLQNAPQDSTLLPLGMQVALRSTADPRVFEVVVTRVGEARIVVPATGDTLRWTVEPRLANAAPDSLRPWMRVGALGPNWWPTVLVVVAILAPLAWWIWTLLRRRGEGNFEFTAVEAPHLAALRRLDELEARGWIAAGRFDEFYVEASHALRAYVGGRYGVPALDWTTDETFHRLLAAGHERQDLAPIDPLLRAADVVKFAAQRPSEHQAGQWLGRARAWILATAVEPSYSTPEALAAAARMRVRAPGGARGSA